jgi:predicted porin
MTATVAGAQKFNGDSYAVAYAINKELSVGLTYAEAKSDNGVVVTTAGKKETTVIAAIGYNLGPVAVSTQYKNVQNLSGMSANDGQQVGVWVNTNF